MYSDNLTTIEVGDQTDHIFRRTYYSDQRLDKMVSKTEATITSGVRVIPTAFAVEQTGGALIGVPINVNNVHRKDFEGTSLTDAPVERASIYFKREPISNELRRAIYLLDQGRTLIAEAKGMLLDGRVLESDEKVMGFREYLPELFCLRTVSDSFGAVINATQNAFANRKGMPLNATDLGAVDELLKSLVREPAMTFEGAVAQIMTFEESGFVVESPTLGGFLDLVEAFQAEFAHSNDKA